MKNFQFSKLALGITLSFGVLFSSFIGLLIYLGNRLLWQDRVLAIACSGDAASSGFGNCLTAFTNDLSFWALSVGAIQAILSVVGISVTGWAALEAARAGKAAQDAVEHSRREYIASFPPKLTFRKLQLIPYTEPQDSCIRCTVRNIGASKCTVLGIAVYGKPSRSGVPVPPGLSEERPWLDENDQPRVIQAGQEHDFAFDAQVSQQILKTMEIEQAVVRSGISDTGRAQHQIYAGWRVHYIDDVGVERVRDGVFQYDLNINRFVACDPDSVPDSEG